MLPQPQIDNLATQFLNGPLNGGAGADVRLFTNNVTPSASTVIGDLIEPTATGYAPAGPHTDYYKTVDSDTGLTMLTQDNVANFHFTDGDDLPIVCYGWFLVSDGGALAYAEKFANPRSVMIEGATLGVDVKVRFMNQLTLN